jgi:hypothetical protein
MHAHRPVIVAARLPAQHGGPARGVELDERAVDAGDDHAIEGDRRHAGVESGKPECFLMDSVDRVLAPNDRRPVEPLWSPTPASGPLGCAG